MSVRDCALALITSQPVARAWSRLFGQLSCSDFERRPYNLLLRKEIYQIQDWRVGMQPNKSSSAKGYKQLSLSNLYGCRRYLALK